MRCKDTAFLPNSKHFSSFLLPFHIFLSRHRIVVRRKKEAHRKHIFEGNPFQSQEKCVILREK